MKPWPDWVLKAMGILIAMGAVATVLTLKALCRDFHGRWLRWSLVSMLSVVLMAQVGPVAVLLFGFTVPDQFFWIIASLFSLSAIFLWLSLNGFLNGR
jgi:hypothetical protein